MYSQLVYNINTNHNRIVDMCVGKYKYIISQRD